MCGRAPRSSVSVDDPVARIEQARRGPDAQSLLLAWLAEGTDLYRGLGTSEAERLRGCVMASFAMVGLPAAALPRVLADLETGHTAYAVAAAARALQGRAVPPSEALELLAAAARRVRGQDDCVSFGRDEREVAEIAPSALMEVVRAIARYGAPAEGILRALQAEGGVSDGVDTELRAALETISRTESNTDAAQSRLRGDGEPVVPRSADVGQLADLEVQDQSGAIVRFGDLFDRIPSVIAFFYTRCTNPRKCSLTITKLASLKRRLRDEELDDQVMIAAFTYDPDYDGDRQLAAYGVARDFPFDDQCRLLRTVGAFTPIATQFDLGVGFGSATVNQHRIDLLVLDGHGRTVLVHAHRLWDETDVLKAIRDAIAQSPRA